MNSMFDCGKKELFDHGMMLMMMVMMTTVH